MIDQVKRLQEMIENKGIDTEEIIEEFGDDCPSTYGLKDNLKICAESGDACHDCWRNAIEEEE